MKKARRSEDRLSSLPDHVLFVILSFLDLKTIVQTSVLSKRWQNLWTSLVVLNFDSRHFKSLPSFDKFFDRVLRRYKGKRIHELSIYRERMTKNFKEKILKYVTFSDIKSLSFDVSGEFCLSDLDCSSLRSLKLQRLFFNDLETPFPFSTLTILHLKSVYLSHKTNCFDPFADLHCLVDLSLDACSFFEMNVLKISAPKLTRLRIESSWLVRINKEFKILISTPSLLMLNIRDSHVCNLSLASSPSLESAYLDVFVSRYTQLGKFGPQLIKMFSSLCDAQSMTISTKTIEVLSVISHMLKDHPCPFRRLKTIKVESGKIAKPGSRVIPEDLMSYLCGCGETEVVALGTS